MPRRRARSSQLEQAIAEDQAARRIETMVERIETMVERIDHHNYLAAKFDPREQKKPEWKLIYRLMRSFDGLDGIYAVIENDGEIAGISKYPTTPRNNGNLEDFKEEVRKYAEAMSFPVLDRDKFAAWDYFMINGWEADIVSDEGFIKLIDSFLTQK